MQILAPISKLDRVDPLNDYPPPANFVTMHSRLVCQYTNLYLAIPAYFPVQQNRQNVWTNVYIFINIQDLKCSKAVVYVYIMIDIYYPLGFGDPPMASVETCGWSNILALHLFETILRIEFEEEKSFQIFCAAWQVSG